MQGSFLWLDPDMHSMGTTGSDKNKITTDLIRTEVRVQKSKVFSVLIYPFETLL
jgi:hypothetical protein